MVVVGFAISRIVYVISGVRFNDVPLHPTIATAQWQLLDTQLLAHDPVQSIWYLHSQPPLYNIVTALILQLPRGLEGPTSAWLFILMGLSIAISTYYLLSDLRVPVVAATIVTLVFVVASPSMILYENYYSWSYPTAACLTVGVLCLCRYLKTARSWWGFGGLMAFAAAIMIDTTFQWLWLVPIVILLAVFMRPDWRHVLVVAALPLALVAGLIVKNAVMFGTTTTSSWVGMNLAQMTVGQSSPSLLNQLEARGDVNFLAFQLPFSNLSIYSPQFKGTASSSVPALNEIVTSAGIPNYNNIEYIALSNSYLHDDIGYLKAEPLRYLQTVSRSARVWFVPSNQFPFVWSTVPGNPYGLDPANVLGYASVYDNFILLEPARPYFSVWLQYVHATPKATSLSYAVILEYLLLFAGVPILFFKRRAKHRRSGEAVVDSSHRDQVAARTQTGTLLIIWFTCVYSFVVTSLLAIGENMRFRFELGTLPLVGCVVVVTEIVRAVRTRRERTSSTPGDPVQSALDHQITRA